MATQKRRRKISGIGSNLFWLAAGAGAYYLYQKHCAEQYAAKSKNTASTDLTAQLVGQTVIV